MAQEAVDEVAARDELGSHLEVLLLTIGPGRAIWERFSHNAIWIRDSEADTEASYNWGIFDFRQESFLARLARGHMLYELQSYHTPLLIDFYREMDRDVWVQTINLTPAQRLELQRLVQANDTDENRTYRYDYYLDNCSTRLRDVLDQVLGGQIRAATESVVTETTFRWHTARLLQYIPWAYTGIQFVVGHPGDRPISAWEEMFLPLRLQRHLEGVRVTGADGATASLLGPSRSVFDGEPKPVPQSAPGFPLGYLLVGIAVAVVLVLTARAGGSGSRAGRWGFALVGGAWSLSIGLAGTALVLSWFLTDHTFWQWNENVLQVGPLSLALAILLPAAVVGRGAGRAQPLALTIAALSVAGLLIQVLPLFDQVNGVIIALALPVHMAMAWGTVVVAA